MIVFLWDVRTPGGSARGVTDDETQARLAVADAMLADGISGRVERASLSIGAAWLTGGYRRLGTGWTARLNRDEVTWVTFRETAVTTQGAKVLI
jgi:hypothetical protein